MKTFLKTLTTILLSTLFIVSCARQTATHYSPKKGAIKGTELKTLSERGISRFVPNAPAEIASNYGKRTPVANQIHTPIKWYAIELANDPIYWQNVNRERVWLELEVGQDINAPEIAGFLSNFQLGAPDKYSMHPNLTNFYVFDRPETTPEQFVEMAKSAQSVAGILFLEPSFIRKTQSIPNDPLWSEQWGPLAINAHETWDYAAGERSWSIMAVIDDAIDWTHEDLKGQVWYGYDYASKDSDVNLDTISQTHGTHVTGVMAATINNGIGIAGMCNDTVYFAKVSNKAEGFISEVIIDAVYNISTIDRVSVVNMSYGGHRPSDAEEQAYNALWNSGKLLVASSGNEGTGIVAYPARYDACMAVGALAYEEGVIRLANYSQYGPKQEVTAPGGEFSFLYEANRILSTMPDNKYEYLHGTSQASPMVAGLAGLMKSINPGLTNVEIRNIINATCTDLGEPGWDKHYGHGMINAKAAVEAATLSIAEVENKHSGKLIIYPNPSNQQFWIKGIEDISQGVIEMYDLSGKLVKSQPITTQNSQFVTVSDLSKGMYMVRVKSDNKVITGKFVK